MLDLIESRSQAAYLGAIMAKSMGSDVDVVAPHEARIHFEQWLNAEEKIVDPEHRILMEALFPDRGVT